MRKKTIQELTIIDNFMFGAVMMVPENCKELLERTLGITIGRIEISKEKSIVYNPEYKGIRLDIYARDEENTHYNVEMQALQETNILKRSRYYHSQLDMELLLSGSSYKELPQTYVIFICDFDPFGEKKYRYTMKQVCEETPEVEIDDGAHTIFLSTKGENPEEVPKGLVAFLEFVKTPLEESERDFQDAYISRLQDTIKNIKVSREMGARYMTFQELLEDERERGRAEGIEIGKTEGIEIGKAQGKSEGILTLLSDTGEIPTDLTQRIQQETKEDILKKWLKLAAKVETVAEFQEKME